MTITIEVPGLPAPGGSKRGFPIRRANGSLGVAMSDAGGERTKNWRAAVAVAARQQYDGRPIMGPVEVTMAFRFPRPRGHYGSGKNAGSVKASAPKFPSVKPDLLKVARSTEDALTGIVWRDDAGTVRLSLSKVYADSPGVTITVVEV